jgi:ribonucleoside-triphosphate reductase
MNEACLNLLGKDIGQETGQAFSKKVLDFMRNRLLAFQEETGDNFNLEATPAEGTSYRLARLDQQKYPDIICANSNGNGNGKKKSASYCFYTNSSQLPVNYTDDVFEALDLQEDIQSRYTGGTVFHAFAGERISDPMSVKQLIRKVLGQYRVPYFTFSPTFSVCPNHGYLAGEQEKCPSCESTCEVYTRVAGYLRPVQQWNEGKQAEYQLREVYGF